VLVSILKFI